jgi:hypothetical protein
MNLLRMFQEGGWVMYFIVLFGLPALLLAAIHALAARKWSLVGAGIALALILLLGVGGTMNARSRVDGALSTTAIDPDVAVRIRAQGYRESNRPIQFAGFVAALGGLLVAAGELRRRKRQVLAAR